MRFTSFGIWRPGMKLTFLFCGLAGMCREPAVPARVCAAASMWRFPASHSGSCRPRSNFFTGSRCRSDFFHSRKFDEKVRQALSPLQLRRDFCLQLFDGPIDSAACARARCSRFRGRRFAEVQAICCAVRPSSAAGCMSREARSGCRRGTVPGTHGRTFVCRDRARRKRTLRARTQTDSRSK